MKRLRAGRPGAASFALLLILLITAGWWALALWPTGAAEPEWLARTRAACFGSAPGGLPDAGGWILLGGQPIGMIAVLFAAWGTALKEDLQWIRLDRDWRRFAFVLSAMLLFGIAATGRRIVLATGLAIAAPATPAGTLQAMDLDLSTVFLVDQTGKSFALGDPVGRPALVSFAFSHCITVCPTLVHDLQAARRTAGRLDVPLLLITLDPWRDTPSLLPTIAKNWGLGPEDRMLSGSISQVEQVLDLLGVSRTRNPTTGEIDHVSIVLLRDARGHLIRRLNNGWRDAGVLLASLPTP